MENVTVTIWFKGHLLLLRNVLMEIHMSNTSVYYVETLRKEDLLFYRDEQSNSTPVNIPINLFIEFNKIYQKLN